MEDRRIEKRNAVVEAARAVGDRKDPVLAW